MNIKKWTIVLGIVLALALGFTFPLITGTHANAVAVEPSKLQQAYKTHLTMAVQMVQTVNDSEVPLQDQGEEAPLSKSTNEEVKVQVEPLPQKNVSINSSEDMTVTIVEDSIPLSPTTVYVGIDWIDEAISRNREEIQDGDLSVGMDIFNRLDTNYMFGLADEGLTEDERVQLETYMHSVLNPTEFTLALSLYNKYVGMLDYD